MYFVYILECADTTLYTGYTTDIERRIKMHNTAKAGAHYTKIRRPVVLKYVEKWGTLSEALKREIALKKLSRTEKITLITTSMTTHFNKVRAARKAKKRRGKTYNGKK